MNDAAGRFAQAWANLPNYLSQHGQISMIALAIGIGISLPLAVWATRSRALRWPVLTLASIIQTIPSIALLALFYPFLLGISYLTGTVLGWFEFSALGFLPTILALTFYSMLPILRNTVTGICGVDPAITEAARGMGMTTRQTLLKVELPLAAPVIIAGVRTSTVWVVGIATLSTPVGQTSLGNYIFTGLQTENWTSVLFGCLAAAILAIVLDQLIGVLESAAEQRRRGRGIAAIVGIVAVFLGGLAPQMLRAEQDYIVGAKTFSEQFILAELVEGRLEGAGYDIGVREGLGSTVIFRALAENDIDVYIDYTGTIWANYMDREDIPDPDVVLREVKDWLSNEHGIAVVGTLGFENAYGLAMRRDRAEELGIETIGDLAAYSADMAIGGDYEFFGRPEWERIRSTYGLQFENRRQYQSTFMYKAVRDGQVDVISAFTSDGRIEEYDLVVLDDPRNAIPPYDAVLLVGPEAAENQTLINALEPLAGAIPIKLMRQANQQVDIQGETPAQAAQFIERRIDDEQPMGNASGDGER